MEMQVINNLFSSSTAQNSKGLVGCRECFKFGILSLIIECFTIRVFRSLS